jgi:fluoride exporter
MRGGMLNRYLMIAIGGAAGAIARYQVAAMVQARVAAGFPWGTFVVNISGCFVMGVVMTLLTERVSDPNWRYLIPIGFIGAYTTFSTFELETFRAVSDRAFTIAVANVLASVVVGYLALWMGVVVTKVSLNG